MAKATLMGFKSLTSNTSSPSPKAPSYIAIALSVAIAEHF